MSDNTEINPGSGGDVIATDDVGGIKYQVVKLAQGAPDAAVHVSEAAPLQVSLANHAANAAAVKVDGSAVTQPVSGAVTLGAAIPAGANNIGDVDVLTLPAVVLTAETTKVIGTVNISAAQTIAAVTAITNALPAGNNNIGDVDIASALPAGTNAIGKLAANTGVTIGAVELAAAQTLATVTNVATIGTSITPGTAAANLGKAEDVGHATGDVGVFALSVRRDTPQAESGTTGDYDALHVDSVGALWARLVSEIADDAAFTPGTSRVLPIGFQADETSPDSVDEGDIGCPRMTLDRKIHVVMSAHTAGGWTPHKAVSAASTNATNVKNGAGQIGYIMASNVNAAARYLKLYNKASAPTVGTDVPVATLIIPGGTTGQGLAMAIPAGIEFSTGISYALTTEATDAGTTGVALSEIVVNIGWK